MRVLVRGRVADHLVHPRRLGEDAVEEERLREARAQAREAAQREVERAVGLLDPRRDRADALVPVELGRERLDRVGADPRVRVEEEHVRRLARAPADVAAVREAAVLLQRDRLDRQRPKQLDGRRRSRRCRRRSRAPTRAPVSGSTAAPMVSALLYVTTTTSTPVMASEPTNGSISPFAGLPPPAARATLRDVTAVLADARAEERTYPWNIGLAYCGDADKAGTWSGTPASLGNALRGHGASVVALKAQAPPLVEAALAHTLTLLRVPRTPGTTLKQRARLSRRISLYTGRRCRLSAAAVSATRSARAQPLDAVVQIQTNYAVPRRAAGRDVRGHDRRAGRGAPVPGVAGAFRTGEGSRVSSARDGPMSRRLSAAS